MRAGRGPGKGIYGAARAGSGSGASVEGDGRWICDAGLLGVAWVGCPVGLGSSRVEAGAVDGGRGAGGIWVGFAWGPRGNSLPAAAGLPTTCVIASAAGSRRPTSASYPPSLAASISKKNKNKINKSLAGAHVAWPCCMSV